MKKIMIQKIVFYICMVAIICYIIIAADKIKIDAELTATLDDIDEQKKCVEYENYTMEEYFVSEYSIIDHKNGTIENLTIYGKRNISDSVCINKKEVIVYLNDTIIDYQAINIGYSKDEEKIIFDDKLDGNGDGIVQPGESYCILEKDRIKCFGHNAAKIKERLESEGLKEPEISVQQII